MSKEFYFYDAAGTRRRVKEFYFYDSAGARKKVKEAYFYDSAGVRRQFFNGGVAAANFTINSAQYLLDNSEGSIYGVGWGFYNATTDNPATATPASPIAVGGVGFAKCLFTSAQNSGDVGLPGNLIIYQIANVNNVPNTDASFASMFVAGIGTFPRASATYYASGADGQGTEWRWTYAGPYFNIGASHVVQFT